MFNDYIRELKTRPFEKRKTMRKCGTTAISGITISWIWKQTKRSINPLRSATR